MDLLAPLKLPGWRLVTVFIEPPFVPPSMKPFLLFYVEGKEEPTVEETPRLELFPERETLTFTGAGA